MGGSCNRCLLEGECPGYYDGCFEAVNNKTLEEKPAISPSRYEELHDNFWAETNEEWTQEWRDELTPEEAALVAQWDERVRKGMLKMCQDILEMEE